MINKNVFMNAQKTHPHTLSINELLNVKREEIIAIAAKHGAFNLRIFGSVAQKQG